MQELSEEASTLPRLKAESIFSGLEILYRLAPAERGEALRHTVKLLDDLILSSADATATDADTALFVYAAALRVCGRSSCMPRPGGGSAGLNDASLKKERRVTGQLDLYGVFLPGLSALALGAYGLFRMMTSLFTRIGLYRAVWHPSLFNLALYVTLVSGLSAILNWLQT